MVHGRLKEAAVDATSVTSQCLACCTEDGDESSLCFMGILMGYHGMMTSSLVYQKNVAYTFGFVKL